MKVRLLAWLTCPACRGPLQLQEAVIEHIAADEAGCPRCEVMAGALICRGCPERYPVEDGVPRFVRLPEDGRNVTARTAGSFGYLWSRTTVVAGANGRPAYHFSRMQQRLALPPPCGLILDAGCGDGVDVGIQARRPGVEIIGVDLSDGGCRKTFERARALASAHVTQADLCALPFSDGSFDFIYSYGVLHHLQSPEGGVRELVRVLKPGSRMAVYLYEDFSDRGVVWQWLLGAVALVRRVTTRLPHQRLFRLCRLAAPVVYLACSLPARALAALPGGRRLAQRIPFRHARGPRGLAGDLYDRFSAPLEGRYSREEAIRFLETAGLEQVTIAHERGWMVSGMKRHA